MNPETITPRDNKETSILATAGKIAGALTVLGSMIAGLLASAQGMEWFTANLPALLGGISILISGGVATGIAVRRMKIDKAAKAIVPILCITLALLLQGCVGTMVEIPINITPPSIPAAEPKFVTVKTLPRLLSADQRKALSRITSKGFIVGNKTLKDGRKELTWTNGKDTVVTTQIVERVQGKRSTDPRRAEIAAVKAEAIAAKAERDTLKDENAQLKKGKVK